MIPEATLWTLLATLCAGMHIFTSKVVAQKGINISLNTMINFLLPGTLWLSIVVLVQQKMPEHWVEIALYSTLGGIFYGVSFLTRTHSLKNIDSVIFFPLNKILGPLIAVVGGLLWFGEYLTLTNYFGVALSILVPLLLINRNEKLRQNNLYLGLGLLTVSTFTGVITHFFTKTSLSFGMEGFYFCLAVGQLVGFLVAYILYVYENYTKDNIEIEGLNPINLDEENLHTKSKRWLNYFRVEITRKDIDYGVITAILGALAVYTISMALATGPISIVYTIHAHYILIPILLSVFFYQEHINWQKVAAVALSMIAIAFLV